MQGVDSGGNGQSAGRSPQRSWLDLAETSLRSTGERVTSPRVQVLTALLDAEQALTHAQIEQRIKSEAPIDRVTVYRVLHWLVSKGLASKVIGVDRAWRFTAGVHPSGENQVHFECGDCGLVVSLKERIPPEAFRVPRGYSCLNVELIVRGTCASCTDGAVGHTR